MPSTFEAVNGGRHHHDAGEPRRGLLEAALPFLVLGFALVAVGSLTPLSAGFAFALAVGCVLAGAFRSLLAYRDLLLARPARRAKR